MKRRVLIPFFAVLVGAIIVSLWFAVRMSDEMEWHKHRWHTALQDQWATGRTTLWGELKRAMGRECAAERRIRDHEHALVELGCLTNHDLLLSNQVLTPEFTSNFVRRLVTELGTNLASVWVLRNSTNHDGYYATLLAKDVDEWERIFRECAARYASNVPPSVATDSPSQ